MWVLFSLVTVVVVPITIFVVHFLTKPSRFVVEGKVVVITGGSSGIGKALAKKLVQEGCHVALIARRVNVLEECKQELMPFRRHESVRISIHSMDVSDGGAATATVADILEEHGAIHGLVCSAGVTQPMRFVDITSNDWERMLRINVVGTRNIVFAALPALAREDCSRIVMVSSQAGQVGIFGYTAYSASKFALRGFAEALQMEVVAYNTRVSLCFPPDTDTPMFEEENKLKPEETKILSGSAHPYTAEQVAGDLLAGLKDGRFFISTGFDGWMLNQVDGGMAPNTFWEVMQQFFTGGILRLVAWVVRWNFDRTVIKMHRTRKQVKLDSAAPKTVPDVRRPSVPDNI